MVASCPAAVYGKSELMATSGCGKFASTPACNAYIPQLSDAPRGRTVEPESCGVNATEAYVPSTPRCSAVIVSNRHSLWCAAAYCDGFATRMRKPYRRLACKMPWTRMAARLLALAPVSGVAAQPAMPGSGHVLAPAVMS